MAGAVLGEHLGFQPGQDAQRLRVALEPTATRREFLQRGLAVVAEGWVADVVRHARHVDQVRVGAEIFRDAATDLRDLERMGEPGARHVTLVRANHLGLARQPAQRGRMQDARAVAGEGTAGIGERTGQPGLFGVLREQALPVVLHITGGHQASLRRDQPIPTPMSSAGALVNR